MNVGELIAKVRARLREQVEAPALEAELLAAAALGCERGELWRHERNVATEEVIARVGALAGRRAAGEPLAYLLGEREFFGRRFRVRSGVLVPRPETEHLVEVALAAAPSGLWADVGTGCGIVAITLALERRGALRCVALDLSPHAVACTNDNARELGATSLVPIVRSDLFGAIGSAPRFAGIVANPPYVEPQDHARLDPTVQKFEPRLALVPPIGSAAEFRARLIDEARVRLVNGGLLALEVGAGQAGVARDQLLAARFRAVTITNDLAGIGRVVSGRLSS